VYNKVNEMAPNEVPFMRTDPRARVGEKVSHIAAQQAHRRDDADRLPVENTLPGQLVGWGSLPATMTGLSLGDEGKNVTPPARHGYTSSG
jgi:hypothetical protein